MRNMHNIDRQGGTLAGGFKFAAAVVVIGLIIAAGTSAVHDVAPAPSPELGGDRAPVSEFVYFPSQYELQATEPEPLPPQF
jgi:hypothetical protein